MKINIPHIHKIEGEAGFWARVAKSGKVEQLKVQTLLGLRQIEGILVGRKAEDAPLVVSRVCGICPVVHILNACEALEGALNITVSRTTTLLRKLMLASQIVQSHTLHVFFMTLADFLDIENDLDLMKKFPREAKTALKIRDFSLNIIEIIGGRKVHPMTPRVGGFSRLPDKKDIESLLTELPQLLEEANVLLDTFKNLEYPIIKRETNFVSVSSNNEYAFYKENSIKINDKSTSVGNFYSNKLKEDLKGTPVKRVKYEGKPYMLGAIARLKNNNRFLIPSAKRLLEDFIRQQKITENDFFSNTFYNLFGQAVEILHFLEVSRNLLREILESDLKETQKEIKINKGSGLSAMEAPRGTLFTYLELDSGGRILNCNLITPTAQFLNNLEEDLKILVPQTLGLSEKERRRKIRSLIRAYDPCISCAVH